MFFIFPRNISFATVTWMTLDMTHVAHTFIISWLDHGNGMQMDMQPSMLRNCQLVTITTTHLLCRICYYELIKPFSCWLLPISMKFQISYKTLSLQVQELVTLQDDDCVLWQHLLWHNRRLRRQNSSRLRMWLEISAWTFRIVMKIHRSYYFLFLELEDIASTSGTYIMCIY